MYKIYKFFPELTHEDCDLYKIYKFFADLTRSVSELCIRFIRFLQSYCMRKYIVIHSIYKSCVKFFINLIHPPERSDRRDPQTEDDEAGNEDY